MVGLRSLEADDIDARPPLDFETGRCAPYAVALMLTRGECEVPSRLSS